MKTTKSNRLASESNFAIQHIRVFVDPHFFKDDGEFFFQHLAHAVLNGIAYDKVVDMDIPRLADTVGTSATLLDLHRIPRKIVVDDDIGKLQVETFTTGIRGNKDVAVLPELTQGSVPILD